MSAAAAQPSWDPGPAHRLLGGPLPALRRVGVLLHPTRDVREPLTTIGRWARREGVSVVVAAPAVRGPLPLGIDPVPAASVARPDGLLIALGGDGTMLRALTAGAVHGTPVLGVKLGHVNFLPDVAPSDLGAALEALALRRFAIEERSMLTARAGGGAEPAVNDVVLRRAPGAPLADVGLHVGGKQLAHYRGDGVIVATPTGSTGYSRSAGGPLVSPRLAATVVTPLASHAAPAGSLVLSAGDPIELRLADAGPALAIEIDGRERQVVLPAARVRIDQSGPPCRLVRLRHQLARTPRSARRL